MPFLIIEIKVIHQQSVLDTIYPGGREINIAFHSRSTVRDMKHKFKMKLVCTLKSSHSNTMASN